MDPKRLLHRGDPALAHAHPGSTRVGGEAVDVLELQPGIRHRLEAGVDGEGERVTEQTAADR
jgi:hypothetical protein